MKRKEVLSSPTDHTDGKSFATIASLADEVTNTLITISH
jgi:hypothetical protein